MSDAATVNITPPKWELPVLYENDAFVVVNKPAGLLTIPDRHDEAVPSVQRILGSRYDRIFTVHRLDRDTSGALVFAKTEEAHRYLSGLFEEREVEKIYQGIVHGTPVNATGTVDAPIAAHPVTKGIMVVHRKGKPALTEYEVLQAHGSYALLRFHIHTGRTHQIRLHMQHIGHPIVCDPLYGDGKPFLLSSVKKKFKLGKFQEEEKPILARLGLHAAELSFTGEDGQAYRFEAPLPKDMRAMLQQLGKINR